MKIKTSSFSQDLLSTQKFEFKGFINKKLMLHLQPLK